MYHLIVRPFLFLLDPEKAHKFAALFIRFCGLPGFRTLIRLITVKKSHQPVEVMGLNFPSRLGLAAGFDKNATMYKGLSALGFGFIEIGTVTPLAQPGNEKPRLFRLYKDKALINRMGFNNDGMEKISQRLKSRTSEMIIGGNIGKNKITPNETATGDYIQCFNALYPYVNYFVVNVSSPNTPGLRELQDKEPLTKLLSEIQLLNNKKVAPKPVLLKIAPDLSNNQLDEIVDIIKQTGISGVVATNTTTGREYLSTDKKIVSSIGAGGLSGQPIFNRSLEVVRYLSEKSKKSFVIIGAGGIMSPQDAVQFIRSGADLVQIYTGFIYEGTTLISGINDALQKIEK